MLKKQSMVYRVKILAVSLFAVAGLFLSSCVSYQIARYVEGDEVTYPYEQLREDKTSLEEVLALLGAPDNVAKVGLDNLLVYERAVLYRNRLKIGIPLFLPGFVRKGFDISAYGTLVRFDSLALFFNSEGILTHKTFERGSSQPYLKTLFSETSSHSSLSRLTSHRY